MHHGDAGPILNSRCPFDELVHDPIGLQAITDHHSWDDGGGERLQAKSISVRSDFKG